VGHTGIARCISCHEMGLPEKPPPLSVSVGGGSMSHRVKEIDPLKRTERQKYFMNVLNDYQENNKLNLHEKIGNSIADRLLELVTREPHVKEDKNTELFYLYVHKFTLKILNEKDSFFADLHTIVDSPLDCDRLDYVTRDLKNSGFRKGEIEYDRLLSSMKLFEYDNHYYFIPSIRTLSTVEDFYARYVFLYKYVVFHHRVIKTDQLLQEILYHLVIHYLEEEKPEEDTGLALPLNISGLWKPVKQFRTDTKFFNLITQWDDSWLFTVLRQIFYERYQVSHEIISNQLEEILSNKKYYHSVIKRMDDFLIIDEQIINHFSFDWNTIREPEVYVKPLKEQYDLFHEDRSEWKRKLPLQGFFLSGLRNLFAAWFEKDEFTKIIRDAIIKTCSDYNITEDHVLVNFKRLKTGLDKEKPFLHNDKGIVTLSEVSRIEHDLEKAKDVFPQFFLYVLIKEKEEISSRFPELLADIGKNIGIKMSKYFKERDNQ